MPKIYIFLSDPFITPSRKNFLNRSFLNTIYGRNILFYLHMVGTFCSTCTVTGYPCFIFVFAKFSNNLFWFKRLFFFGRVDTIKGLT